MATEETQLYFVFNTEIRLVNNKGEKGGALTQSFYKKSVMSVHPYCNPICTIKFIPSQHPNFTSNLAIQGGGIFVQDKSYLKVVGQELSRSVFFRIDQ